MNATQKKKQLQNIQNKNKIEEENDADIFIPTSKPFDLGGKVYEVGELPFNKMLLLKGLEDVQETVEGIERVVNTVAKILNEEDIKFIGDNLVVSKLAELGSILREVNYRGIPTLPNSQKKNINSAKV